MYQYNTKNTSFLKMYKILSDFGIENNAFFLELKDESLIDVDPLDPNLDKNTKLRVINEVMNNPWYYLREVVRIPTAGEKRMFELTRGTLAICWSVLNNLSSFVVLPRQCYKTYTICGVYSWMFYFGCKNTEFMMFSYSDAILQGNLQRIKEIRDTLPEYLNMYDSRTDKDNAHEMKFVTEDFYNQIRIKAPSKSPEEASKVGRGFSTPCMWFDEVNFIPQIGEIYDSSSFAYKTVADIAKRNGSYHHRIMSSSVGRLDEDSGLWGFNFLNNACDFTEKMYDYEPKEVVEMIKRNSTNNFLRIEYMYYDLSKQDNYLEEMRKDATTEEAFQREVLNRWQKTGAQHPLGKELVDLVADHIDQPSDILVVDNVYFLKLYKPVDEIDFNKRFVAGVDCGGNLNRDFSTFVVVDPENYEVIAVLRSNSYSTNRFAKCLVNILTNVFTNTILLPERNNMGVAIVDFIKDNFPFVSNRVYEDIDGKPGFCTTQKSRDLLYNVLLRVSVTNQYKLLHDSHIINEIIALQVGRNGRIDHPAGGHDDTIMAYLFTRWFFTYAKNISRYIDPSIIGRKSSESSKIEEAAEERNAKANLMKNLKNGMIVQEYTNADGTLNFNAYNPMYLMDRSVDPEMEISDVINRIGNRLSEGNIKMERTITHLDSTNLINNEDDNFDIDPTKLGSKVEGRSEKVLSKQEPVSMTTLNRNDFTSILGM